MSLLTEAPSSSQSAQGNERLIVISLGAGGLQPPMLENFAKDQP